MKNFYLVKNSLHYFLICAIIYLRRRSILVSELCLEGDEIGTKGHNDEVSGVSFGCPNWD